MKERPRGGDLTTARGLALEHSGGTRVMGNASATVTESDRDDFYRLVVLARRDLARKRQPRFSWSEACYLLPDDIRDALDVVTDATLEACRKAAPEAGVESLPEVFWEDILGALIELTGVAFWQGLTSAHVALGGEVGVPYRLFPGPRQ